MTRKIGSIFIGITLLSLLFYFHTRGLFYPDEGYILHTAQRILSGQIIYKDFDFVYTPLSPILAGFGFLVFGESVLASRIIAFSVSVLSVILLYGISRKFSKKIILSLLVIAVYISWGPSHINFIWPTMTALFASFLTLILLLNSWDKQKTSLFVACGVSLFIVFLSKQNFGVALFLGLITPLLFRRKFSETLKILSGFFISLLLFLSYLLFTQSVISFGNNFYVNVIQKIIFEKTITTPLLYQNTIYSYVKLLFYLSPLILSLYAFLLSILKRSNLMFLSLFPLVLYLAGFRPVFDYIHLSPLLSLSGLPLFVITVLDRRLIRYAAFAGFFIFILVGLYSAFFWGYYRWETPLINQNTFSENSRVRIFVDEQKAKEILSITDYVDKHISKSEYVFINYYAPMVYFLMDRKNPTRYDYLSNNAITPEAKKEIISILEEKGVRVVLTHYLASESGSDVGQFIANNYRKEKTIFGFSIWLNN